MMLKTLTALLSVALFAFSGCSKIEYMSCPTLPQKTTKPILDLNNTGEMVRISKTHWKVTHKQVLAVKKFERDCNARDADYTSTLDAINTFNEALTDSGVIKLW